MPRKLPLLNRTASSSEACKEIHIVCIIHRNSSEAHKNGGTGVIFDNDTRNDTHRT